MDRSIWYELCGSDKFKPPEQFYQGVGCEKCRDTGFLGRTAIYEMLSMVPAVTKAIEKDISAEAMHAVAASNGMRSLRLAGAAKVASGVTTPTEVVRVIPPEAG